MTVAILPACVAAVGASGSDVTVVVTVDSELFAVDTGVAVVMAGVVAVVTAAFHGFFTSTSGVVAETLDVSAEGVVALEVTRGFLNSGRSFLVRGVASSSVVTSVPEVESSVSGAVDPSFGQEEVGLLAPKMPPNRPVRVVFDGLGVVDVESALDSSSVESASLVLLLDDEPVDVFAEPVDVFAEPVEVFAEPVEVFAPSLPELVEDESDAPPSEPVVAEATPAPVNTATPTPKAAAKAPIRPI